MVALNGRRVLVGVHMVSEDYFSVLGVPDAVRAGLSKDRPSLIVSHSFWMRELERRPDVIGQTTAGRRPALTRGRRGEPGFSRHRNGFCPPDLWIPVEAWPRPAR